MSKLLEQRIRELSGKMGSSPDPSIRLIYAKQIQQLKESAGEVNKKHFINVVTNKQGRSILDVLFGTKGVAHNTAATLKRLKAAGFSDEQIEQERNKIKAASKKVAKDFDWKPINNDANFSGLMFNINDDRGTNDSLRFWNAVTKEYLQ